MTETPEIRERPILFSAPMVRAILDGRKTQTRRIVKGAPVEMVRLMHKVAALDGYDEPTGEFGFCATHSRVVNKHVVCPHGFTGDRLWVRETWQTHCDMDHVTPRDLPRDAAVQYPASYDGWVSKRRPAIHMPRWASRISLRITDVRVERLNDISEIDALAEGFIRLPASGRVVTQKGGQYFGDCWPTARAAFRDLWQSIHGAGSWDANPWVWALTFERVHPESCS